jgi:hypothetical protein
LRKRFLPVVRQQPEHHLSPGEEIVSICRRISLLPLFALAGRVIMSLRPGVAEL